MAEVLSSSLILPTPHLSPQQPWCALLWVWPDLGALRHVCRKYATSMTCSARGRPCTGAPTSTKPTRLWRPCKWAVVCLSAWLSNTLYFLLGLAWHWPVAVWAAFVLLHVGHDGPIVVDTSGCVCVFFCVCVCVHIRFSSLGENWTIVLTLPHFK